MSVLAGLRYDSFIRRDDQYNVDAMRPGQHILINRSWPGTSTKRNALHPNQIN